MQKKRGIVDGGEKRDRRKSMKSPNDHKLTTKFT